MGIEGIWFGYIFGFCHQIIAYFSLVTLTDWRIASNEAESRISLNTSFIDLNESSLSSHAMDETIDGISQD